GTHRLRRSRQHGRPDGPQPAEIRPRGRRLRPLAGGARWLRRCRRHPRRQRRRGRLGRRFCPDHASRRPPCPRRLARGRGDGRRRRRGRHPDRLLHHRRRHRPRGCRRRRPPDARRPRLRRHDGRRGCDPHLHGRRPGGRFCRGYAHPLGDGPQPRPLRRRRRRPGRQGVQQHDARRQHDRHRGGFRPGREARPHPPGAVRRRQQVLRPILGADLLLPRPRPGPRQPGQPRLQARLRHRADGEGSRPRPGGRRHRRRRHPARRRGPRPLPPLPGGRAWRCRFLRHHRHAAPLDGKV
ncbi:MAG: 3-hydroxyisobutyrate dehydrogenase, partial [uncultured Craurococcus sp.]